MRWRICAFLLILLIGISGGVWWAWGHFIAPLKFEADHFPVSEGVDFRQAILVKDRFGEDLGRSFVENRELIDTKKVSPFLVKALLFSEDKEFYNHRGISLRGLLRAISVNIRQMAWVQGGSTITQQLAKNLLNRKGKALDRKIMELFLSLRLEREYSKDEILALYLNRVSLGNNYYGVEAASKGYFGHSALTLDASQSAILVALLQAPTQLSPYRNRAGLNVKAERLLYSMKSAGLIDSYLPAADVSILPRFQQVNGVKSYPAAKALNIAGDLEEGCAVQTTIEPTMQDQLEKFALNQTTGFAAGVVDLRSGDILAYVGGRDFLSEQYDRFYDSRRNTGTLWRILNLDSAGFEEFAPAYPKSSIRLLLQDALSLNWRPILASDDPATASEILARLPGLAGYASALRLVPGQSSPILPPMSEANRQLLAMAQANSSNRSYHNLLLASSSIAGTDGWGVVVGGKFGLVTWIGYDKPAPMGTPVEIEEKVARLTKTLADSLGINNQPLQVPQFETHEVDRNTGITHPRVAGTVAVAFTPLEGVMSPFMPELGGEICRKVSDLTVAPAMPPVTLTLPAPRPSIETSDEVQIATSPMSEGSFFFWPRPEGFHNDTEWVAHVGALGIYKDASSAFWTRRFLPVPLPPDYPRQDLPNTVRWPVYGRSYQHQEMYRNIIGIAGPERVPEEEVKAGMPLYTMFKGRSGLELWFDRNQMVTDGSITFFPDLFGCIQDTALQPGAVVPPVRLTIRHAWQEMAINAMGGVDRGAFLLMDASTGAIRASVSKPLDDEFNRTIWGSYPAGSAIKPFVAVAGLKTLGYAPTYQLGSLSLEGTEFDFPDESGESGLYDALVSSHNSYFITLGQDLGGETLMDAYSMAGFGSQPDMELPTPSRSANAMIFRRSKEIAGAELANLSLGQGDFLTSPLQMARAYAWLGTRGRLVRPRILERSPISSVQTLDMDPMLWFELERAMSGVVGAGTGRNAFVPQFRSLKAKTGTAQVGQKGNYSYAAWFAGTVTIDSVLYSFAVAVESQPGVQITGGGAAAPVLRKFLTDVKGSGLEEGVPVAFVDPEEDIPKAEAVRDLDTPLADRVLMQQF